MREDSKEELNQQNLIDTQEKAEEPADKEEVKSQDKDINLKDLQKEQQSTNRIEGNQNFSFYRSTISLKCKFVS